MKEANMRLVGSVRLGGRLLPLALAAFFITGCKYDNPGSEGTLPTGAPAVSVTCTSKAAPATTEVRCNERYKIHVQVTQPVESCSGYNFTNLYQRARDLAEARMGQLTCPQGQACTVKHAYYTLWRWDCSNNIARVRTKASVLCLNATDAAPQSIGNGASLDKTQPANQRATGEGGGFPPGDDGELIEDSTGAVGPAWSMSCPSTTLLRLIYKEKEPVGIAPENHGNTYQGFVERAEAKARMIHGLYACATGCSKRPYRALHTSWAYVHPNVEVTIHFQVECPRP
jgi:hypothetical protein